MELQPANLFIRGVAFGGLLKLVQPMTVYKYLSVKFHQRIIADPPAVVRQRGPLFVTSYRYYTSAEALCALALPGPMPSHVLEMDLAVGAELQGPVFVNPLSLASIAALKYEHRYGNGIEFLLWTPLSQCLAAAPRVVALPSEGTGP